MIIPAAVECAKSHKKNWERRKTSNHKSKCLQLHQRFINSIKLNNAVSTPTLLATRRRHVVGPGEVRKMGREAERRQQQSFQLFLYMYISFESFLHLYLSWKPLDADGRRHSIHSFIYSFSLGWLLTYCSGRHRRTMPGSPATPTPMPLWLQQQHGYATQDEKKTKIHNNISSFRAWLETFSHFSRFVGPTKEQSG